jgi:hypothetical protein
MCNKDEKSKIPVFSFIRNNSNNEFHQSKTNLEGVPKTPSNPSKIDAFQGEHELKLKYNGLKQEKNSTKCE